MHFHFHFYCFNHSTWLIRLPIIEKKYSYPDLGPEKNKNDSRIRIHNTDLDITTGFSAVAANPQTEWPKLLEKSYIILFKPCDCSQNNVA